MLIHIESELKSNYDAMEEEHIIDMMKRIHDYINGRLSEKEEDALWIEFLKEPYWYNIF